MNVPAKYFEDFLEGETFITPGRTVTESDVVGFAGISGDYLSLHTDAEAAKLGYFRQRIAHGVLTLSIAEGLWMRLGIFEGSLLAYYGIDRLRFTRPVFIGDTVRAKLTVNEKKEKGAHLGLVSIRNEVINQNDEVVLVFDALLLFKRRAD